MAIVGELDGEDKEARIEVNLAKQRNKGRHTGITHACRETGTHQNQAHADGQGK